MKSAPFKKLASFLTLAAVAALVGCNGGTPIPPGLVAPGSGTAPSAGSPAPLMISIAGFVGGEAPAASGGAAASMAEKSKRVKTNSLAGVLAGANGLDLKDAAWNNLFSSGLSVTALPSGSAPTIRFKSAGASQMLGSANVGDSGLFNTSFDARALRTGTNLILEMTVNGFTSEILLPVLTVDDGDKVGFNAIRRFDGSLVVELFVDGVNNETQAVGADGRSDNGLRVVVDNGFDIDGDGKNDTLARMDSNDGLSIFDLNLDGRFGDPNDDSLVFIDSNGDGFADTPYHMASSQDQELRPSALSLALIVDPELDGILEADAERRLSEGLAANFIAEASVSVAPNSLPANGLNTASVRVEVRPTTTGLPFDAQVELNLSRHGGETLPNAEFSEARFLANNAQSTIRVLDPSNPAVRLFFNGKMVLTETLIAPLLTVESVNEETFLNVNSTFIGRETGANALTFSNEVKLDPSMAPLLSTVLFTGQNTISGVMGGLEVLSRHAVLTWGDAVQINGENFATGQAVGSNIVTIGGVLATNVSVNPTGTQLNFTIPEGASTGPLSVVVGGLGGKTNQNLVIAGEPFEVLSVSPTGTTIPGNAEFTLLMSRPVDDQTLGAVSMVDFDGESMDWDVFLGDDARTIRLVRGEGSDLEDGIPYRIRITSNLAATDAQPLMHFDPERNVPLVSGIETAVVLAFTAGTADFVQPILDTTMPAEAATNVDIRSSIVLAFSEAMSTGSIADAVTNGALELVNNDTFSNVDFTWQQSADLRTLTLTPNDPLAGNTAYTLSISASNFSLTDTTGNSLMISTESAPIDFHLNFTTGLGILDISPRSGPVGTVVTVTGGNFASSLPTATIGGLSAAVTVIDQDSIEVTVPTGSASFKGGPLSVTVGSSSALAPVNFTVTLDLKTVDLVGAPGARPIGVALSRDDRRIYVSNQGVGTVAAYDLDSLTRIDADGNSANGVSSLALGRVPSEAKLSRNGRYLLTLDYGTQESEGDSFFVVNVADGGRGMGIESSIGVGKRPTRIAVSPDGSRWYVTNNASNTVSVISAEPPFQVLSQIPTGEGPNGVTISADGRRGYVCNYFAGTVTVFDTASNEAIGEISVGAGPARAILSPNGKWVLVTCNSDNTLHIIDALNNTKLSQISVHPEPSAMTFGRDGSELYVTSRRNDIIARYRLTQNTSGAPVLTEDALIGTARTPSGLAVTSDGSRLVVTNEGAGYPQVIFLETPVQTILRVTRQNFEDTTIADRGEVVVIQGKGFASNPSLNTVLFNGAAGQVDINQTTRETIVVRIPEEASSGPLTVVVNERESSPVSFAISPRTPKLVASTPINGGLNVAGDAEITLKFNEPIIADIGDVMLQRRLDTFTNGVRDIDPTPIAGSLRLRDFGREMIFTPSAPLVAVAGSNNIYRFTVNSTVRDHVGNRLEADSVVNFRLADTRGPTLVSVNYIDVDNNGVDVGDVVNFLFDEPVSASGLPLAVGANGSSIAFSDSSTFGTGATFELPNLALLERTSPPNELGDLSRTIMVRLGTGASMLVPGMRTAVTDIVNLNAPNGIRDGSGNTGLSLSTPNIDVGIALASTGAPKALSIVLVGDDGDGVASDGEVIAIYLNQPVTLVASISELDFVLSGAGASFGVGATIALDPANARVIRITLGTGGNFDFNDATSGTPTFSLTAPAGLPNALSFLNAPVDPWSSVVYSIGLGVNGPRIATTGSPVVFRDLDANGPDAGDIIEVRFDAEVTVGAAPAALCFSLPVVGNSFGTNAFIRGSQNLALTAQERGRTVEIVLGPNAKIRPAGLFAPSALGFGAASGIDIASTLPVWAVADVFGNSARPNEFQASDVGSDDVVAPSLFGAVYRDENGNNSVDAGDAIIIIFDETMLRNGVLPSHFRVEISGSQIFNLGTGASLTFGPNKPVNGIVVQNNSLRLTLGNGTDLFAVDGLDIVVESGNPASDVSGNLLSAGSRIALDLNLPETPMPILAMVNDADASGTVTSGDRIWVKFNRSVNLAVSDPNLVFNLINPMASFGDNPTVGIATVDAALIATGMTHRALGQSDPQILSVTLGSNASLPNLAGVAPTFVFDYVNGVVLNTIASPVGIAVQPSNGAAFTTESLRLGFNAAGKAGSPNKFEGILATIETSGGEGATDSIFFDLELPGGASTFLPIASHADRLVSALNAAFKADGRSYRAFYRGTASQVVITSNDGSDLALVTFDGPNVTGTISSTSFFGGVNEELTSTAFPAITARGSVDLSGTLSSGGSTPAPMLVSAVYSSSTERLDLTFDRPITVNTSYAPGAVFDLLVSGDSLGIGSTWQAVGANAVRIALGGGHFLHGSGTFANGVVTPGSPSGIRVSPSAANDAIRNLTGTPADTTPIDVQGDDTQTVTGPGPLLVSAVFDSENSLIIATFDQDVSYDTSTLLSDLFLLPVSGDSFGFGGEQLVASSFPNQVTIQLGSTFIFQPLGDFDPGVLSTGAPSGLAINPSANETHLANSANTGPQIVAVDIDGASGGAIELDVGYFTTGVSTVPLGFASHGMALIHVSSTSSEPAFIDRMAFDIITSMPVDLADIASRWRLFEDLDASGTLTGSDVFVATGARVSNFVEFISPSLGPVSNSGLTQLLLVMDASPNPALTTSGFQIRFFALEAIDLGSAQVQVFGLPATGAIQQYVDDGSLPASTGLVARTASVGNLIETGDALSRRAAIGTRSAPRSYPTTSSLSANDIQGASVSDLAGTSFELGLNGKSGGFTTINLPANPSLITAEDKTLAIMIAIQTELQLSQMNDGVVCSIDSRGNLVLRGYSPDLSLVLRNGSGFTGQEISGRRLTRHDGVWGEHEYAIYFGGENSSGVSSQLDVFVEDKLSSEIKRVDVPVFADPLNGLPVGRQDAAMTIDENGIVYLNGGQDGPTIFFDTWSLTPIFGSYEVGQESNGHVAPQLHGLRWRRLMTGSATPRHSHTLSYVSGSHAFPGAGLVAIGGQDSVGALLGTVSYYHLASETWSEVNPVSGTIPAIFGHMGGYSSEADGVIVAGGATDGPASQLSTNVFGLNFVAGGEYVLNTMTPVGGAPSALFRTAAAFGDEDHEFIVAGGLNSDQSVSNEVSVLRVSSNFLESSWLRLVPDSFESELYRRASANLVMIENSALLSYGIDSQGNRLSTLLPVELFSFAGNINEDDDLGPVLAMLHPLSGGTANIDTGEMLEIYFDSHTNLNELYPSGTLTASELNSHLQYDGTSFPVGTTATVSSRRQEADVLTITFGGGFTTTIGSSISFAENMLLQMPLMINGNRVVSSSLPVMGTPNPERFFTWIGTTPDFFDANNWVKPDSSTGVPGVEDVAYIPAASLACFINDGDGFSAPSPVELGQVIVIDSHLRAEREVIVGGGQNSITKAVVVVLGGLANFGELTLDTNLAAGQLLAVGSMKVNNFSAFDSNNAAASEVMLTGPLYISNGLSMPDNGNGVGSLLSPTDGSGSLIVNAQSGTTIVASIHLEEVRAHGLSVTFIGNSFEVDQLVVNSVLNMNIGGEIFVNRGLHMIDNSTMQVNGSSALVFGPFCDEIAITTITGADLGFVGFNSNLNSGFEFGMGGVQTSGAVSIGASGSGRDGVGVALESSGNSDTISMPNIGLPFDLNNAALTFAVKTNGSSNFISARVFSNNAPTDLGAAFLSSGEDYADLRNEVWKTVTIPFSADSIQGSVDVEITIFNSSGFTTIDNLEIVSWYPIRSGSATNSVVIDLNGDFAGSAAVVEFNHVNATLSVGSDFTFGSVTDSNSMLRLGGNSSLSFASNIAIPSGASIDIAAQGRAPTTLGLTAGNSIAVNGTVSGNNVSLASTSGNKATINLGGDWAFTNTTVSNLQVDVGDSNPAGGGDSSAGIYLDDVSFSGTPGFAISGSPARAYVLLQESGTQVMDYSYFGFISGATAMNSLLSSKNEVLSSFFFVNSHGGTFAANFEDDPQSVSANEADSGNIRWSDIDYATITYVDANGDRITTTQTANPGDSDVVLMGMRVTPKTASVMLQELVYQIYSNIDEELISPFTSMRVLQDDGDGVFSLAQDTTQLTTISLPSVNDPNDFAFWSPINVSTQTTFWVVADVSSSVPLGANFNFQFDMAAGRVTYPNSFFPDLSESVSLRIGGASEPSVSDAWIQFKGFTSTLFNPDAQLIIQGANLDQSTSIVVEFDDGFALTQAGGTQMASPDGRYIYGVDLTNAPSSGPFTIHVTVTPISGPPRTFLLSTEFNAGP